MKNLSQYVWKHVENLIWRIFETFSMESHEEFEGRESLEQSGWNPVENSPAWEQWSGRSKPVSMYPPLLLSKHENKQANTTKVANKQTSTSKSKPVSMYPPLSPASKQTLQNKQLEWSQSQKNSNQMFEIKSYEWLTPTGALCCATSGLQCAVQIFAFHFYYSYN